MSQNEYSYHQNALHDPGTQLSRQQEDTTIYIERRTVRMSPRRIISPLSDCPQQPETYLSRRSSRTSIETPSSTNCLTKQTFSSLNDSTSTTSIVGSEIQHSRKIERLNYQPKIKLGPLITSRTSIMSTEISNRNQEINESVQNWMERKDFERKQKAKEKARIAKEEEEERQELMKLERKNFTAWLARKKKADEMANLAKQLELEEEKLKKVREEDKKNENLVHFNMWKTKKEIEVLEKQLAKTNETLTKSQEKAKRERDSKRAYNEWLDKASSLSSIKSVTYINPIPWVPNIEPEVDLAPEEPAKPKKTPLTKVHKEWVAKYNKLKSNPISLNKKCTSLTSFKSTSYLNPITKKSNVDSQTNLELEEEVKAKRKQESDMAYQKWMTNKKLAQLEKQAAQNSEILTARETKAKREQEAAEAYKDWMEAIKLRSHPTDKNKQFGSLTSVKSVSRIIPIPQKSNTRLDAKRELMELLAKNPGIVKSCKKKYTKMQENDETCWEWSDNAKSKSMSVNEEFGSSSSVESISHIDPVPQKSKTRLDAKRELMKLLAKNPKMVISCQEESTQMQENDDACCEWPDNIKPESISVKEEFESSSSVESISHANPIPQKSKTRLDAKRELMKLVAKNPGMEISCQEEFTQMQENNDACCEWPEDAKSESTSVNEEFGSSSSVESLSHANPIPQKSKTRLEAKRELMKLVAKNPGMVISCKNESLQKQEKDEACNEEFGSSSSVESISQNNPIPQKSKTRQDAKRELMKLLAKNPGMVISCHKESTQEQKEDEACWKEPEKAKSKIPLNKKLRSLTSLKSMSTLIESRRNNI